MLNEAKVDFVVALIIISVYKQINKNCARACVRICVRKTFQNLLKLEKIGKSLKNYVLQIQQIIII